MCIESVSDWFLLCFYVKEVGFIVMLIYVSMLEKLVKKYVENVGCYVFIY